MDQGKKSNMQLKEKMRKADNIYKLVGYALESCQVFEGNIKLMLDLLVHQQLVEVDEYDFPDVVFYKNDKTIGAVLRVLKDNIDFDKKEKAIFYKALNARNYLVHRFFNNRTLLMLTSDEMKTNIENEVKQLWGAVKKAIDLVTDINKRLWKLIGVSPTLLEKAYESLTLAAADDNKKAQDFLEKMSENTLDDNQNIDLVDVITEVIEKYSEEV